MMELTQAEFLSRQLRYERDEKDKEIARLRAVLKEIRDDPCSDADVMPNGKTFHEFVKEALGDD